MLQSLLTCVHTLMDSQVGRFGIRFHSYRVDVVALKMSGLLAMDTSESWDSTAFPQVVLGSNENWQYRVLGYDNDDEDCGIICFMESVIIDCLHLTPIESLVPTEVHLPSH